jgi:hypothetical protein
MLFCEYRLWGGAVMVPEKYIRMGFEIVKFGAHSKVLRFNHKPIFVFEANANIDLPFLTHICETYLKITEKRGALSCIKA